MPTYKSLLCLCISPYAWGAWVWITGSIGTHPHFSSLAMWGSPLLLSHSAQTPYSSQSSVAGQARILWSVLRAPGPACHAWREEDEREKKEQLERCLSQRVNVVIFFSCSWLTSQRDHNMMSSDCLDPVKDNEWPGASMLRKLIKETSTFIFYTVSATLISVELWMVAVLSTLQAWNLSSKLCCGFCKSDNPYLNTLCSGFYLSSLTVT